MTDEEMRKEVRADGKAYGFSDQQEMADAIAAAIRARGEQPKAPPEGEEEAW